MLRLPIFAGTGGAPPLFDPTSIAGLVDWWKADSLALTDGALVASWPASGGSTATTLDASGTARPTFKTAILNGLSVVRFDGSANVMRVGPAGIPAPGQPCSIFIVYSGTASGTHRALSGHGAAPNWLMGPYSGSYQVFAGAFASTPPAVTGGLHVLHTVVQTSSLVTAYLGGTSYGTISSPTENPTSLELGASVNFGEFLNGDIAEVVIYSTALGNTDRSAVETYLISKWGL